MSEVNVAERVGEPGTVDSLAADLRAFDVERGDILLVHSSLSSLGQIAGGSRAVIDALQTVLADDGTLVMPIHTGQYTDPSVRENLLVPGDWVGVISEPMPSFRPDVTPARRMSAVPKCLHNHPGVAHSEHSTVSFAARGAATEEIIGGHELDCGLGDRSPLVRAYDRGGDVLLLDVGHGNNTPLHLAERRTDFEKTRTREHTPLFRNGERVVVECDDVGVETDGFKAIGEAFERRRGATEGPAAAATATLLDQPTLVDFAEDWFEPNR